MKPSNLFLPLLTVLLWFGCMSMPDGSRPLFVPQTNAQTGQITYTINPGVTNVMGKAGNIAQKLPMPWGDIATSALGVSTGVLAWIAKKKSDSAALVPALIAGIESAPNNADVKTSIHRIATQTGVEKRLNKAVKHVKSARAKLDFGQRP